MPLTVIPENGTGLANANAYFSLATVETEMEKVSAPEWDLLSAEKKNLLLVGATAQIDLRYRFYGKVFNTVQALQWPRTINYDNEGRVINAGTMPKQLLTALTYTMKAASEDQGFLDFDTTDAAGVLKSWSTDGLSLSFGTISSSSSSSGSKEKNQPPALFEESIVEVQVLLRSIGELKNTEWVESNKQTMVF